MDRTDLSRAQWRKARRSSGNGACVEVAALQGGAAIRDSKAPNAGALLLAHQQLRAFLADIRAGRHDLT